MWTYLFASRGPKRIFAFSIDGKGGNLPDDLGPWQPIGGSESYLSAAQTDHIAAAVRRDGFYVLMNSEEPG